MCLYAAGLNATPVHAQRCQGHERHVTHIWGRSVAGHKKAGREGSLDFLASFDNLDQKSTPLIDQRKGVLSLGCDLRKRSHGLTSVMIQ